MNWGEALRHHLENDIITLERPSQSPSIRVVLLHLGDQVNPFLGKCLKALTKDQ